MAAPLIARTPIFDDDLTGTTGTILDNLWKQELYDQIDADVAAVVGSIPVPGGSVEVIAVAAGGTVVLGAAFTTHILSCNPSAPITLGVSGGSGVKGEQLIVYCGASVVNIPHGGVAGGTPTNNFATSAPTPLSVSGMAVYTRINAGGGWFLTSHEQGAWITPPFNAANFTANGAMIWTVAAGNVAVMKYGLRGRALTVKFQLATTTIGGTPNTSLSILNGAFGGFSFASNSFEALAFGTELPAYVNGAGAQIGLAKSTGANWTAGSQYHYGGITGEVS